MSRQKKDYLPFFKKEVKPRFKVILKTLDQQTTDLNEYNRLSKKIKDIQVEFQEKLTKNDAGLKFIKILNWMKEARDSMYSLEKVNTLIVEYCDLVNNLLDKKELYVDVSVVEEKENKLKDKITETLTNKKKQDQKPKTVQLIEKTPAKRYFLRSGAILLIGLIVILFLLPSGDSREYNEHIFPRTIIENITFTENISLLDYQTPDDYLNSTITVKGRVEFIRQENKYNISLYKVYLIDNEGYKILLEWKKRNDVTQFVRDGITQDYFYVKGEYRYVEYETGGEGPMMYVIDMNKTTLNSWQDEVSTRLPAMDVTKEKPLTVGSKFVYRILDGLNITNGTIITDLY